MAATAATPEQAVSVFQEFRAMFYVLGPNESSFRSVEEVPDYVDKVRAPNPTFLSALPSFLWSKLLQLRSPLRLENAASL